MAKNGPFGLSMGIQLEDIQTKLTEVGPGRYAAASVPRPHSAFESYVLQITPQCGLAWIKAIGHTISTNSFGTQVIAQFEDMETKLAATYGAHETTDLLLPGSIWNEPQDWMQGLKAQERILMAAWSAEHGSTLPESMDQLALIGRAIDTSSGYIAVEYCFANSDAADAEIAALEDDVL